MSDNMDALTRARAKLNNDEASSYNYAKSHNRYCINVIKFDKVRLKERRHRNDANAASPTEVAPVPSILELYRASMSEPGLALPSTITEALDDARFYKSRSLRPPTFVGYESAWRRTQYAFADIGLSAHPPMCDLDVCMAISRLARWGYSYNTIKLSVTVISVVHQLASLPDPSKSKAIRDVMQGIKNEFFDAHGTLWPNRKDALMVSDIKAALPLLEIEESSLLRFLQQKAMLLVSVASAMRRSELARLQMRHLRFRPSGVYILIERSKTSDVAEEIRIDATGSPMCPVAALRAWIDAAGITSGTIWPRIDRWGNVEDLAVNPKQFNRVAQRAAVLCGLPKNKIGAHSARAGFVTESTLAGVPDAVIIAQTRHATTESLSVYHRPRPEHRFDFSKAVGL